MNLLKIFCAILIVATNLLNAQNVYARTISLNEIAQSYKLSLSGSDLVSDGHILSFKDKSRTFKFDGIPIPMGFPAKLQKGKLYIDDSVLKKSVLPFIITSYAKYHKVRTIAIDAGHGGVDDGTKSVFDGTKEKVFCADICSKLASILKKNGYKIVLTRPSDKKVELIKRSEIANANKADLFISIHLNSAPNSSVSGTEIFVLTPAGALSTYGTKIRTKSLVGNKYDRQNLYLGYLIQKHFQKKIDSGNRGVKYADFVVLKNIDCPGALVECGFLSNSAEAEKISSDQHRYEIASTIASAIIEFDKVCGN